MDATVMDIGFGVATMVSVLAIVAIVWAILVEAKETRRRIEREANAPTIEAEVLRTPDVLRATAEQQRDLEDATAPMTEPVKRERRRLAVAVDELGEWTPAAHVPVDAFLFEQTAHDFGALRRFAASAEFAGAAA
jgi:hypothetical protein